MKKHFFFFIALMSLAWWDNALIAQVKIYPIDPWHSYIRFTAVMGGIIEVQGTFNEFQGSISFADNDLSQLSATIIIEAKSIDTNVKGRDNHLRSEDFLFTEKYPQIKFTSSSVVSRKGEYYLIGELELHGVTKVIEVQFTRFGSEARDVWKNPRATFKGQVKINRNDFGVGDDPAIEELVTIDLNISARTWGTETQAMFGRPFATAIWGALEKNDVDLALELAYELFLKDDVDAKKSRSLDLIAIRLEEEGRFNEALKFYLLNIERFPDQDDVYGDLANAYFRRGMKEKAIEASQKALDINAENTVAIEIIKLCR